MITVTVEEAKELNVLDLLSALESLLRDSIDKLVTLNAVAEQRDLLRLYQKELLIITDFRRMLELITKELARSQPANNDEMDEFLDIEEKARAHACELLQWIENTDQKS